MLLKARCVHKKAVYLILIGIFLLQPAFVFALQPNDPLWKEDNAVDLLHLPEVWEKTQGSREVVVAVIDTGIDMTNPEISENIWSNPMEQFDGADNDNDGNIDDLNGWNFVENNGNVRPRATATSTTKIGMNHGTVVAGIIGAQGNNFLGGAGVAWRVKIMPLKILNEHGDGDSDLAVKAIDYAIKHKADIINLSFVGPTPSLNFIQAIRRAYRAGITVIAAAGNAPEHGVGVNLNMFPQYPVCFDDPLKEENWVIGVAALGANGLLGAFSNHGSKCVDIAAPGYKIPSTLFFEPAHNAPDVFGGAWSGTSVAAPFVTGVAVLIKSIQPAWGPDEIRKALIETSDPIPGNDTLAAGRGSVNALKAVDYALHGGASGSRSAVAGIVYTKQGATLITYDETLKETRRILIARGKVAGASALVADVDGSGATPFVVAYTDAKGPLIKILQQDGTLIKEVRPFGRVRGAVHIAVADVDRDGASEIIAAVDNVPTIIILRGDGSVQTKYKIPDARGSLQIASVFRDGVQHVALAVTHKKDVTVYVTDAIGSFISSFKIPTRKNIRYSFGAADRSGAVDEMFYIAELSQRDATLHFYDLVGTRTDSFLPASVDGKLLGVSFAHVGDEIRLTATTLAGKALQLSIFDRQGLIAYTLDRGIVKGEQYDPFVFAP